eukprot:7035978-Lingulodinium_polyedra.AAC.1
MMAGMCADPAYEVAVHREAGAEQGEGGAGDMDDPFAMMAGMCAPKEDGIRESKGDDRSFVPVRDRKEKGGDKPQAGLAQGEPREAEVHEPVPEEPHAVPAQEE